MNVIKLISIFSAVLGVALYSETYLPQPGNCSGEAHIQSGDLNEAHELLLDQALITDSSYHFFKLGFIQANRGKGEEALEAFGIVVSRSDELAPFAHEQIALLKTQEGLFGEAFDRYGTVLDFALPSPFRQHIFEQIHQLVLIDSTLHSAQPWFGEYRQWASKQLPFDIDEYIAFCDSLIREDRWSALDSSLEVFVPVMGSADVCRLITALFDITDHHEVFSGKLLFALADQAHRCGQNVLADQLLSAASNREDFASAVPRKSALLLEADIAFRRGQFKRASKLYQEHDRRFGNESRIVMQIARCYRRLGDTENADRWYDRHIQLFAAHQQSEEIRWLRAWDYENAGKIQEAASVYKQISHRAAGRRAHESHIRYALCLYRLGNYGAALNYLDGFVNRFPGSNMRWAAMFWQGKCQLALGREQEAYTVFRQVIKLDPADYYAHRARQILTEQGVETPGILIREVSATEQVYSWLDSISPSSRKRLSPADSTNLRLGALLSFMGRAEHANLFLGSMERDLHANLRLQFDLAAIYSRAGARARAFGVARRLAWRIPVEHREVMPLSVYNLLYPPFYSEIIVDYAQQFEIDPLLVSAVMRQESIFDKHIVSPAGAIGLMQIMPNTGRLIASQRGEEYEVDSLYNPVLNIRYGAHYITKRLNQFNGDLVLMLAAYNAGAHRAQMWYDRNNHLEFDLFVENIGFTETRNYIKKVLGNYWTYQKLSKIQGFEYYGL